MSNTVHRVLTFSLSQCEGKGPIKICHLSSPHRLLDFRSTISVPNAPSQCSVSDGDPSPCTLYKYVCTWYMYSYGVQQRIKSRRVSVLRGLVRTYYMYNVLCEMGLVEWYWFILFGARDKLCDWTGGKNSVVPCRYIVLCYAMCWDSCHGRKYTRHVRTVCVYVQCTVHRWRWLWQSVTVTR